MISALVLALLAQSPGVPTPHNRHIRESRRTRGGAPAGAFFEAFGATGSGTFGVCSTTSPTGSKGETLTFTRASAATCTKTASGGLATTGIADGDLVSLSSNVARVEYDSSGTLGLLVEAARTSSTLRSQELLDAAWSDNGTASTKTSDFATAPDGTMTAERFQFPAVGVGAFSQHLQTSACPAGVTGTKVMSMYVKNNGVGSAKVNMYSSGGCIACTVTDSSWTRCVNPAGSGTTFNLGSITSGAEASCPDATLPAADLLIWGAQCEAGAYATSYIPTTSAAVTRAAETANFAGVTWLASTSISMAGNVVSPSFQSGTAATTLEFTGLVSLYNESGGLIRWYNGTGLTVAISSASSGLRWYGWHTGATRGMAWGATTATGADVDADNKFGATLSVGGSAGGRPDGILSRICVDPSPERCR